MNDDARYFVDAQGILDAMTELAARWHRADLDDPFSQGRRAGYVQAIGLVLGRPYAEVLSALESNAL